MKNLEKYAEVLCRMVAECGTCYFGGDCRTCEINHICCNEEKLLAFMMQPMEKEGKDNGKNQ